MERVICAAVSVRRFALSELKTKMSGMAVEVEPRGGKLVFLGVVLDKSLMSSIEVCRNEVTMYSSIKDSFLKLSAIQILGLVTFFISVVYVVVWFFNKGGTGTALGAEYVLVGASLVLAVGLVVMTARSNSLKLETDELKRELENSRKRVADFEEVLRTFADINFACAKHMKATSKTFEAIRDLEEGDDIDAIYSEFRSYSQNTLTRVCDKSSELFTRLLGVQCASCVKIVSPRDMNDMVDRGLDQKMISTVWRDTNSKRVRTYDEGMLYRYPYYSNSAFKDIFTTASDYYCCDDLDAKIEYQNCNPDRKNFYNAVCVHAVRVPDTKLNDANGIMGFFCVDSMRGGFGRVASESIISAIAHAMSQILIAINDAHSEFKSKAGVSDVLKD